MVRSALLAFSLTLSWSAATQAGDLPQAVTTSDPSIPTAELALLLVPLSKEELLTEANGWQEIVKHKAQGIAQAEIAVLRENKEIEKAEEIKARTEDAKAQLEEVAQKVEQAKASGDQDKVAEARETALAARDSIRDVAASVDETAEAVRKASDESNTIAMAASDSLGEAVKAAEEAQQAVAEVQSTIESAGSGTEDDVKAMAKKAQEDTQKALKANAEVAEKVDQTLADAMMATQKIGALEEAESVIEQAEETKKAQKIDLLEAVSRLREERTLLLDNMRAVVDELEAKTDKDDSDTRAKIKDYRRYISSVSGIHVDVSDTTSAWLTIKGWVTSDQGGLRWLKNVASFAGILALAWFLAKLLSGVTHKAASRLALPALLADFLVKTIRWVVMIIGVIWALAALEVSVAPLLAVVGAAGFIIAFAMQDSLSNFASGLMILFFRPFDMGDVVDAGGVSGKVSSMNLVATTIRTFDNKTMVVPNSKIWSDVITNATGVTERRVDLEFGIGYGDDIEKAEAILAEIVTSHPKVLKDPAPVIKLSALADSSVNFICRPWARPADYWDVYWDITKEVKKRFDSAGIGIPFPQRDVHLYLEKDADADMVVASMNRARRSSTAAIPEGSHANGGLDT